MVRNEMFADTRLDTRPRPGSEEPELGLRSSPRPPDPFLGPDPFLDPDPRLGVESAGRSGLSSPRDPEPSRAPTRSAALPVGSLWYLALVGVIAAATIGIFFGAGLLLLVHAGKETIAGTGERPRPYTDATRADLEGSPAPRESAAPDSTAAVAPPGSALAQPAATAEVPQPQQSEVAETSPPGAPTSHPPARTALQREPASSSPGSPPSAAPLARPAPFSAADLPASGATARLPTRDGRRHHSHTASRHWHPRSGYNAPTLTPPQSGPFDRLLGLLTGRPGLLTPPLTPPRAQ
jgi:hypothetical protein